MRICIFGSGAIGGYLGVQLQRTGAEVSLIARGPHLAAMRANGVTLLKDDEEYVVHPRCTDDPAELGPQDYVIEGGRAQDLDAAGPGGRAADGDRRPRLGSAGDGAYPGFATPTIDVVLALVKQRAQNAGLYEPLAPAARAPVESKAYAGVE